MDLSGILNDVLSGDTVSQISQTIGADESTTSSAIQAALPVLLGQLSQNSASEEGASALSNALGQHDGGILDNIGDLLGNISGGGGAAILGHILGGQQSAAEEQVSQSSGLSMSKASTLLAILAPIVMGVLGRSQRESGWGLGDLMGVLGGAAQSTSSNSGVMGMISSVLDRDGDGSAIDDVAGMIGGMFGRR